MAKRAAFGGARIGFEGRTETAEQIFGKQALTPPEMTKRLWDFVKKNGLMRKLSPGGKDVAGRPGG
jgi:hypothetical protein